jgi:ferredoxin
VTRRSLAVNPIACDGHGICAELLPEMVKLDDWGYPIIDPNPVSPHLEALARRAVAVCPTLALRLRRLEASASPRR